MFDKIFLRHNNAYLNNFFVKTKFNKFSSSKLVTRQNSCVKMSKNKSVSIRRKLTYVVNGISGNQVISILSNIVDM